MTWKRWFPHAITLLLAALLVLTQQIWAGPIAERLTSTATGSSKTTINYQGYLTDSSGNPVNDPLDMVFRLYNVESGGEALWTETQSAVAVSDGLFSVLLGSGTPISTEIIANNDDLWLGIAVGGDEEMSPREKIASAPYALLTNVPNGSITTEKLADGAVTSAKLAKTNGHISLIPEPDKLVEIAVLRQDGATNSYQNNQVILTGWNYVTGNDSEDLGKNVAFGLTFSQPPVVLISKIGRLQSGTPTSISDFTEFVNQEIASAEDITTTGFRVVFTNIGPGNLGMGIKYGFSWIAIGTLE